MSLYKDITIIIVSYKSEKLIIQNLKTLKKFPTIIINNSKSNKFSSLINDFKNIKLINNEECFFNHEDFVYINDEINENIKKGYFLLVHPIYRFFDSNEYYIWTISKKEKTLKNCNNIRPIKCQQCNGFGHFSFNCKKK